MRISCTAMYCILQIAGVHCQRSSAKHCCCCEYCKPTEGRKGAFWDRTYYKPPLGGSLPPTACFSTRSRPLSVAPLTDWLRLFLNQTFCCTITLAISSRLLSLTFPNRHAMWTIGPSFLKPQDRPCLRRTDWSKF